MSHISLRRRPYRLAAGTPCRTISFLFIMGACCAATAAPAPANMLPVAVTGWNRDVVVESTAVGPPYTNYAAEMNAGEGTGFYQTGLGLYPWGMPPSGRFVSLLDS